MTPNRLPSLWMTLAALVVVAIATGCANAQPEPEPSPTTTEASTSAPSPQSATPTPSGAAVVGSTADVITGLAAPWSVAVLADGTALISQRDDGQVLHLVPSASGWTVTPAGVVPGVVHNNEGGLLGLAVAPAGDAVYAMLTTSTDNRVVRMAWDGSSLGPASAIFTGIAKAGNHNGGRLTFGPDGMLFIATGDAARPASAQEMGSVNGKILRVTPEGAVPADNPFPGSPVYTLGHRNVQGLVFDDAGRLWASEFGNKDVDELNLIQPGANYGWPTVEGAGSTPGMTNPIVEWSPTAVASPSGLTYVDGSLWIASLRGQTLYQVPLNGAAAAAPIAHFTEGFGRLRDAIASPTGDLWILTNNTDGRGSPVTGDDRIVSVQVQRS